MADSRGWFSFGLSSQSSSPPAKLILGGGSASSGSPGVATPTWDVERDTDALFRKHGVEEIKQIERQTRLDIDSRREELRQMVGEKYRDLIDAADSIVDMRKCSEQVKHSVGAMESLCQKLQQTHFLKGSGGMRGPAAKNDTHGVAAQLKLLTDCPEKMWMCLEGRGYLQAAQHYLLARHVYSHLGLQAGGKGLGPGTGIHKLWQPIANFKDTILECCHGYLQCSDLEEGPMVQCLCAMVLLEGCSPRQVFTQFLLARKAAVQSTLQSGSGVGRHRSIKNQICHLAKTLLHSLLHIAAIFCQHRSLTGKNEMSLLLQQLQQFHSNKQSKAEGLSAHLIPDDLLPLLSASIPEFRPTLRSAILTEIPATDIHTSTEDWITMCASDVLVGVEKLLQHVTSIKAISSIKAAIHALLATPIATSHQSGSSDSDSWVEHWTEVSQLIVNRNLSIWDTFFQPVLLQRVKLLLEKRFSACNTHASTRLSELLSSIVSNPSQHHRDIHCHSHLWEEDSGYLGAESGIRLAGGVLDLSLKSKACTPGIYGFCQSLGKELEGIIEDVSYYIQPLESATLPSALSGYKSKLQDVFPFPLYADTATIRDFLQLSANQWISRFLEFLDGKVAGLQQSIGSGEDGLKAQLAVDMLLVLGRLCQCLLECCESLSYLVNGANPKVAPFSSRSQVSSLGQFQKEAKETALSATDCLQKRAISIFKIWSNWTSGTVTSHFGSHLSSEVHLSSLASSLIWSEITISEEAESGKQVSSVIQVPSQPSTYVSSLLFALSQEIGHVGGHAMDRLILQHLSGVTLVSVVEAYENLLKELDSKSVEVPQPCALQLFYNLKFVAGVLTPVKEAEESVTERIRSVLLRLQGWVDPFDLDVFMPYLLSNLENQLSKSSVMLGVLLGIRGFLNRPHAQSSSGQDKHMLLPLAPVVGRIQVLPLSSRFQPQHHKIPAFQDSAVSSSLLQRISYFHHL